MGKNVVMTKRREDTGEKIRPALTKAEADMLHTLEEFFKDNGHAPTIRELGAAYNLKSPETAQKYVKRLRDKGYVSWELGKARTLIVL